MDHPSETVHARTSGIPRLSKLPLPRVAPHGKDGSRTQSSQSNQIFKPGQLTSQTSVKKHNASTISTKTAVVENEPNPRVSKVLTTRIQTKNPPQIPSEHDVTELEGTILDAGVGQRSPKEPSSPEKIGQRLRKPRPSLSDRTIETLSQIPPSPSPYRKKSRFFTDGSPMQPPSRPASALNHSRSNSRVGTSLSATYNNGRPPSPLKRLAAAPNSNRQAIATPTPSRRAVSSFAPKPAPLNLGGHNHAATKSISKLHQPSPDSVSTAQLHRTSNSLSGSKTCVIRPPRTRPSIVGLFDGPKTEISDSKNTVSGRPRHEQHAIPKIRENGHRAAAPNPRSTQGPVRNVTKEMIPESQEAKVCKASSSMTLRQTIAAAKAARRAVLNGTQGSSSVPRSIIENESTVDVSDLDPFTLHLSHSSTNNVILTRINSARGDGRLNIAALGLSDIPKEVANMYDQDATNASGIAWYECVDLIRLNAADNEIRELHQKLFPDVMSGPDELDEDHPYRVFASLELMDMHGNALSILPLGLGRLDRLTNLNLSRNRLTNDALEIIGKVQSLRELRVSENLLQGSLPECLCNLEMLEILDIHNNAVSCLSSEFARLSRLKVLTVSDNKLSNLPFEAMIAFPLVELDASKNRLSGSLFPSKISEFRFLRHLSVSENALDLISKDDIEFPSLQTMNIAQNKISSLPHMANWKELSSLVAGNNQLGVIPEGLVSLPALKTIDLSCNKMTRLDDRMGLMVNLQVLEIRNNPLRERRLFSLNLDDLKAELRARLTASEPLISPVSPTATTKFPKVSEVSNDTETWTVFLKSGILDRSNSKLRDIEHTDLVPVLEANVKTLVLHHNVLQEIPLAITGLGFSLATLDISNNKLGQSSAVLTQHLPLPNLQTLNIASNSLTSLSSLTENLLAPSLRTLNISFNRLINLPPLRETFLGLTKVLASNNRIVDLEVGSVCGLQILDVSSNEIAHLPPKLALLQGELKTLMVGGNRFRVPSWGVVQKGTEEVLSWLRKRIPEGEEGALIEEADSVD